MTAQTGLDKIRLVHGRHPEVSLEVTLFGANITSWKIDDEELLFIGRKTRMDGSKPIRRGGIPISFPHHGPGQTGFNGFARRSDNWQIVEEPATDPQTGDVTLRVMLRANEVTRREWDHAFSFHYKVVLRKDSIGLEAQVENNNKVRPFDFSAAFLPHFKVEDIAEVAVHGLFGAYHYDRVHGMAFERQWESKLEFHGFVDRIYPEVEDVVTLARPEKVVMNRMKMPDVIAWHPGRMMARISKDLAEAEYRNVVCLGAGTGIKPMTLAAGENCRFALSLERVG